MRVIGLDLGAARIGVAVSDPGGVIASPYEVIARSGDRAKDHGAIAALVDEVGAERVIVGMPLSLSGAAGPAAEAARAETAELAARLTVPVETYDERLTTVAAQRTMRGQGVKRKQQRKAVDKVAAAVMLQSWLDRGVKNG
jgi:putative Holliday junction resolvase